ncbi:MAG TPA: hypothetical protein VH720_01550 [Candidatus Limnocylindrales bacterium]
MIHIPRRVSRLRGQSEAGHSALQPAAAPTQRADPEPGDVAVQLADWGFLASPDLPDRPGPATLFVALRSAPTLRHYDPEQITYWVSDGNRGVSRELTRDTRMPIRSAFAWGMIRIVDRVKVTNDYLAFGGRLTADAVEGMTAVAFLSPAPILRRGGHSQGWDAAAEQVGAFFGRLKIAIDYTPGIEARCAAATPLALYGAFLVDFVRRYESSAKLRELNPDTWLLLSGEERRLRADHPDDWMRGWELVGDLGHASGDQDRPAG